MMKELNSPLQDSKTEGICAKATSAFTFPGLIL